MQVQEVERRALARDLHDELGQYLNAIKIDAVGLRDGVMHDPHTLQRASGDDRRNIDLVQGAVVGLIRQLRPAGLDEFGLAGALEQCVNEWRRRLPHTVLALAIEEDLGDLDEPHRLTVYRLVQEALTWLSPSMHRPRTSQIHVSTEAASIPRRGAASWRASPTTAADPRAPRPARDWG